MFALFKAGPEPSNKGNGGMYLVKSPTEGWSGQLPDGPLGSRYLILLEQSNALIYCAADYAITIHDCCPLVIKGIFKKVDKKCATLTLACSSDIELLKNNSASFATLLDGHSLGGIDGPGGF